jgi:hypothetical protein
MRLAVAIAVGVLLAACASQQHSSQQVYLGGNGARSAEAALDAEVIMHGMAQARSSNETVARDLRQGAPGTVLTPVTR